jgi:hypothetical protein
VAAFVIAMALHAGAVAWFEMQPEKAPVDLIASSEQS